MYRILGSLAAACNDRFTTLQLPAAIRIDPGRGLLVPPRYDGDDLAGRWSETDGGARLPVTLAGTIAAILADLAGIDTAPVTGDPVLSAIPGLVFDHAAALTRSAGIARQLSRAGLLSGEDCARAEQACPRCHWSRPTGTPPRWRSTRVLPRPSRRSCPACGITRRQPDRTGDRRVTPARVTGAPQAGRAGPMGPPSLWDMRQREAP
jgi:hypothetical protein